MGSTAVVWDDLDVFQEGMLLGIRSGCGQLFV